MGHSNRRLGFHRTFRHQEPASCIPPSLNAIVLVVLHRPWDAPTRLKQILSRSCDLPVVVAADGESFRGGTVSIGEPAEHLTLAAKSFGALVDDPEREFRNRTVDLLFRSVAVHGGNWVIGVVSAEMLDDGSRGLAEFHKAGGLTMVVVPTVGSMGMPENAIRFDGQIDLIGTPTEIGAAITLAVQGPIARR